MLSKMLANGSLRVSLNPFDKLANRSLRAVENPTFLRQDRHTPLHINYTALRECMAYVYLAKDGIRRSLGSTGASSSQKLSFSRLNRPSA